MGAAQLEFPALFSYGNAARYGSRALPALRLQQAAEQRHAPGDSLVDIHIKAL